MLTPQWLWLVLIVGAVSLVALLIIIRVRRAGQKELAQLKLRHQREVESLKKEHQRTSVEQKTVQDRSLAEEAGKSERAISSVTAELERQKEIARIAASISNEQAKKLQFFADVAQQLRTPLSEIIELLEKIGAGEHGRVSNRVQMQLQIATRDSRHLLRFIDQFHDISQLQIGKMHLKLSKNDLMKFIVEIMNSMSWFAAKKNIQLDVKGPEQPLPITFDVQKLGEVFYHLISNAFKHTPEGGKILISVAVPQGEEQPEESIQIRVKNTGGYIPPERIVNLFDVFHRSEFPEDERPRIGLSLVKELINLHGGEIRVRSDMEIGTEFIITLPLKSDVITDEMDTRERLLELSKRARMELALLDAQNSVEEAANRAKGGGSAKLQNAKILIVEDNENIRELLKGGFKERFVVAEASNGKDGLQMAKEVVPDVIIADIMMPELDGLDFCRGLKSDEKLNHIPVILLTAKSGEDTRMEGIEAGADAYITKPFNFDELLEKVQYLTKQASIVNR